MGKRIKVYKGGKAMAFCEQCGTKLNENVNFCGNCGKQINQKAAAVPQAAGSSTISIERIKSLYAIMYKIKIFIDGKQVLDLKNGETKEIPVDNGKHFIHCEMYGMTRSDTIEFEGKSNKIGFIVVLPTGLQAVVPVLSKGAPSIPTKLMLSKISESPSN